MLEGGSHAFEDLAIQFAFGTLHDQLGRLTALRRSLPDDSRQTRDITAERHHASLHESVLDLGGDPRLLRKERVRLLC